MLFLFDLDRSEFLCHDEVMTVGNTRDIHFERERERDFGRHATQVRENQKVGRR